MRTNRIFISLFFSLFLFIGCTPFLHVLLNTKNRATIKINIIGQESNVEINYMVLKKEIKEEIKTKGNERERMISELLDKGNKIIANLPWNKEFLLQRDDVIYMTIKLNTLKEKIIVQLIENDRVLKEYIIKSNFNPFYLKYEL